MRSEVAQAVLPMENLPSVMKRRKDVAGQVKVGEGTSDIVISVRLATASRLAMHGGHLAVGMSTLCDHDDAL